MNKLFRNLITGSLVGITLGVAISMMKRKQVVVKVNEDLSDVVVDGRSRGMMRMVRNNTKDFARNVKESSDVFSKRLARRLS